MKLSGLINSEAYQAIGRIFFPVPDAQALKARRGIIAEQLESTYSEWARLVSEIDRLEGRAAN